MIRSRAIRLGLAAVLAVTLTCAVSLAVHLYRAGSRIHVTAYFENSNGIFVGDDVRIRGVNVGRIDRIEAQPDRVKISFWFDDRYAVPAEAKAVILSPTLITARAIQLTPPYQSGPRLRNDAVIGADRTAVPMEWDDFRTQLEKLAETLQPTRPGGESTLGLFVSATANNLRGQGTQIRDAISRLSQAVSSIGDHSSDTFTSVKNLATLVSALRDSTNLIRALNGNLAQVTGLLANEPGEIGVAVRDLDDVVGDVQTFVANNRETFGTSADRLTTVSKTLFESLDDIKQTLHIAPNTAANGVNLYQPAQATITGIPVLNNFADPISFLCGAIQAAARLGAEQSAKLCVQYLAPIIKNRQYNTLPIGLNPFVGATARPNELSYSEDRLRPDYVPLQPRSGSAPPPLVGAPEAPDPNSVAAGDQPPRPTDPQKGLMGIMSPQQMSAS